MPSTSDQRALAITLGALSDADLAALFATRGVTPTASWRDLFDAADALLDPASVARGLSALPRSAAAALWRAVRDDAAIDPADRERLASIGLADADGTVFPSVRAAVAERPPVEPDAATPAPASSERASAAAAERAFTHTASLADIVLRALEVPLARIGSGELGAGDRRALVESGVAPSPELADILVGIGATAGLLAGTERAWAATADAREWLRAATAERWSWVARALRDALPAAIRDPAGGWTEPATWAGAYPYDAGWPARAETWRARLAAWGLLDDAGALPLWAQPLAAGGDADLAALQALLPGEVDRVYLQNDLTAIAPGPLAPNLDVRLRRMARRESRAQASSYRFDADTVAAAITAGETAESLRAFLTEISLTGLPQPLAYVIDRTAASHGRVRVGLDAHTGRTRVTSEDAALLDTIEVDQALRPLGLVRDEDALVSRVADDAVFWALADARYPVIAVDGDGVPRVLDRGSVVRASTAPEPQQVYGSLIERLRAAAGADGDAAWLERELDQAVRARAVVDVVVSLPDGTSRTFRLEASGFGGGRLRGRDRGADVERTLPIASIVSVHPVA